jgi:hypothetical protein
MEAMSRTDKDIPWWIESEWYEPFHGEHCIYLVPYFRGWGPRPTTVPCDLPDEPRRDAYVPWYRYRPGDRPTMCVWEPCYGRLAYRYRYTRPPTKRERHSEWYGPVRAQLRDRLTEARKQYQGSGDVEMIEEPIGHHRHASLNGWWN